MENTNSSFKKIYDVLKEMGLAPEVVEKDQVLRVGIRDRLGLFDIYFEVQTKPSLIKMMIHIPLLVQEEWRVEVAELIVRANYGWPLGYLSLNMSHGILVWYAGVPLGDGIIEANQIEHLLSAGIVMIHHYFPAINRLIYGDDLSPAEAIAEVETAAPLAKNRERRAS